MYNRKWIRRWHYIMRHVRHILLVVLLLPLLFALITAMLIYDCVKKISSLINIAVIHQITRNLLKNFKKWMGR